MSFRRKIFASLILLTALVAGGVSAYLAVSSWQAMGVVGCTGDAGLDCDSVLASPWSRWLGVPVAAFGSLVYLAIAIVCWPATRAPQSLAMPLLGGLTLAALGAGLWFVGLQLFELRSFCIYCLFVHACGLAIALLTLALYFLDDPIDLATSHSTVVGVGSGIPSVVASRREESNGLAAGACLTLGVLSVLVLVGGQLLAPSETSQALEEIALKPALHDDASAQWDPRAADSEAPEFMENTTAATAEASPRAARRLLNVAALPEPLNLDDVPMLGSPDAPHVVVEMLDYTCSHCRELHPRLTAARERYGDELAIALCHTPLEAECNNHLTGGRKGRKNACEYARLAVMVWQLAPAKFSGFHNWLMQGRHAPSIASARKRALSLVGNQVLIDQKLKASVTERLTKQCDDWNALESGLPVLLFSDSAVSGGGKSDEELFTTLEIKLGLQPPTTGNE